MQCSFSIGWPVLRKTYKPSKLHPPHTGHSLFQQWLGIWFSSLRRLCRWAISVHSLECTSFSIGTCSQMLPNKWWSLINLEKSTIRYRNNETMKHIVIIHINCTILSITTDCWIIPTEWILHTCMITVYVSKYLHPQFISKNVVSQHFLGFFDKTLQLLHLFMFVFDDRSHGA